jgi:2-polyprenyl-6-methoxyphenol hydroxylase-like FAD-dependent oxidoreductase
VPVGNIINLWPPPLQILKILGVDTEQLGAPSTPTMRRSDGHSRVQVRFAPEVLAQYGGAFIGMLRPQLYERM